MVDCDPNDLISAITQANSDGGGTLTLAEKCTYTLTVNHDGNGLPEIIQPVTIDGNGATIARAANADQFRFFEVGVGGDLKLRHLTLTRGKAAANEDGGAIHVTPAGRLDLDCVTLHNNTVDDTGSDSAGAIYNQGVTTVRNSTLSGNSGDESSAIFNVDGKLEITTSKLTGNTAMDDGAVANEHGTITISKSLLSHNYGSAIDQSGSAGLIEIDRSAILYNHDDFGGGGIDFTPAGSGGLHVRKSTIAYNTAADGDGGGLRLTGSAVIEDSKIYGNTIVDGNGGGVLIGDEGVAPGEAAIRRTVISGNQAPGDGNTGGGIYITEQS
ncbi:right-handed parallel beta-helix repeat-containing protein, partial [Streptomyces sp. NPDC059165]|uniref:right-handed parallel beta-helix repeat-containing protein n=2 Tax=unclassified Streptomyces TaxID=2593676 RepID=UPI0036CC1530